MMAVKDRGLILLQLGRCGKFEHPQTGTISLPLPIATVLVPAEVTRS
jgi:hypothetical protein